MADTPGTIALSGKVKLWAYDREKCLRLPIGANISVGLVKWSGNKIVNCVADDTNACGWAIEPAAYGIDGHVLVCLDRQAIFELKYTGTPENQIGTEIGIADHQTADFGETTNAMLVVLDYDSHLGTVLVQAS